MLAPNASTVAKLGDRVADLLAAQNVPVDEVLQALDEERQSYYQERYIQK